MFIGKEDRLSRAEARRRPSWDGDRRPPRNWRKAVLMLLYALLGLLGGLAVLAGVALFLQPGRSPAPLAEATPPPLPATPAAPPPAAAPDSAALQALQQQVRDANAALAALHTEAERLRQGTADVARQPAVQPDPQQAEAAWADAERTVHALGQRPSAAVTGSATPAPPPPATGAAQTNTAANEALAPPTPAPLHRPRVFLHYQSGSAAALQVATDIAQRLLFSDFAYADTRSAADAPIRPVIRYFFPEDAPAALRLADLLGGAGSPFRVQDASDRPGRATSGTLDVWIGR